MKKLNLQKERDFLASVSNNTIKSNVANKNMVAATWQDLEVALANLNGNVDILQSRVSKAVKSADESKLPALKKEFISIDSHLKRVQKNLDKVNKVLASR